MKLIALMIASLLLSIRISSILPMVSAEKSCALRSALAVAIWPFVLGLSILLAIGIAPGIQGDAHIGIAIFVVLCAFLIVRVPYKRFQHNISDPDIPGLAIAVAFPLIMSAPIIYFSLYRPLIENDALEYMLAARVLFKMRSLEIFPLVATEAGAQGFIAPWTHPPLYVSLLYATFLGHDLHEASAISRLVSPFFLITAAIGISLIGFSISLRRGLLASALYLCIPLLAIGAEGSSIDPLPAAACVVSVLLLVCVDLSKTPALIWAGVIVGAALLSHSQAVLLLPIFLLCVYTYRGEPRGMIAFLRTSMYLLFFSLCIPGYFYFKNIISFGAVVSDNPSIYQLPALEWRAYFEYTRQLSDWVGVVVYGVFKGLSRPGSFGLIYWLFLMALALRVFQYSRSLGHERDVSFNTESRATAICLTFVFAYFLILMISLLFGRIDLIKNDRYPLLVSGPLAIFTALTFSSVKMRIIGFGAPATASGLHLTLYGLILLLLGINFTGYLLGSLGRLRYEFYGSANSAVSSGLSVMEGLANANSGNAKTLSLRPADFYFGEQEMLTYSDDRLLKLYGEQDPKVAHSMLVGLGVKFVHVPEYLLPPVYNSVLIDIIANPNLTDLIFDSQFNQLYRLKDWPAMGGDCVNESGFSNCFDSNLVVDWKDSAVFRIPGKIEIRPSIERAVNFVLSGGNRGEIVLNSLLLRRIYTEVEYAKDDSKPLSGEFLVRMKGEGRGLVEILIAERACESRVWGKFRSFANFHRSSLYAREDFSRRFLLPKSVCAIRFALDISNARGDSYRLKEFSVGRRASQASGP